MSDEILRQLAAKAGVAPQWTDQAGEQRDVSPDSLRAILFALGLPADDDAALRNSLSMVEGGANAVALSRFTTARVGQPVALPIALTAGSSVELLLEGGAQRVVTTSEGYDGSLLLPAFDEPGYHIVRTPEGDFTVATAPERCITFADLNGSQGFGLAAQIYSLRSTGDGGIGHFGGVAALGRSAAARGAQALAISPVHALYGAEPGHFSPYSPSTRLFYNPLHADPSAAFPDDLVRAVIDRSGLAEEMARLSALPQVDWIAATPLRQRLLRGLHDALRDPDRALGTWNYTGYDRPEVNVLIEAIGQEFDPARRQSLIDQAAAMLRADAVYLPLHHQALAWAHRDRVRVVQRADDVVVLNWITLR